MSLYEARMPSLKDKLSGLAKQIEKEVEEVTQEVGKKEVKKRRLNK